MFHGEDQREGATPVSSSTQPKIEPSIEPLSTGQAARLAARRRVLTGTTAGIAPGYVQGNLVVLPAYMAADFMRFAQRNPKPCPLIGVSEPGSRSVPELGRDIDIATDLPRYRIWRDGELIDEPLSVEAHWRDDLVSFVIGCSFTFEESLLSAGVPLRHVAEGANVAMYRTSIPTHPAGLFRGPMVVSMRPFRPADAIRAIQITSRFPAVHGAPIHIGLPEDIGIDDIGKPDYGDPVEVKADELPVFWACGVTPQAVIAATRPDFAITHAPGCMLVTDRRNTEYAVI
jgi:uncharacterized protein YcsI (UPF0317 family)